jgi:hypothetical protein
MALSTSGNMPDSAGAESFSMEVGNTVNAFSGGFAGITGPDNATSQGYAIPYENAKGVIFAGGAFEETNTGDTSAAPPVANRFGVGTKVLVRHAVTGVASRGDIGKPVYASDDNTLTLTHANLREVVGIVIDWHTGTTCDVLLFGIATAAPASLTREIINLGSFDLATVAGAGDLRTAMPLPFHGEFLETFAMVDVAIAGAGGTVDIALKIGTTLVSGGVVTASTAAGGVVGTKLAGTAITGNSVFHEGDTLDVEAATVTSMSAGRIDLYAIVRRRLGA